MSTEEKTKLIAEADAALDQVRPHLKVDGGNVEVVDITDDFTVKVKWLGNCEICSMSAMTMKAGIEETIRQKMPQVKSVEAINGVMLNG